MDILHVLNPTYLINTFGLWGVILIIFAETGLFIGFFLPGDSLLFLAGALAATTEPGKAHLPLIPLLIGVGLASTIGAQVGFHTGRLLGDRFINNPNHRLVKPKHIERSREALEKYGEFKAVMFARVIPLVRTFINPVVGALGMSVRAFTIANVVGGLIWSIGITLLGYALGSSFEIDKYIIPVMLVVIVLSVIPVVREMRK